MFCVEGQDNCWNYRAVIIIIFAYILKTIDENPSELSNRGHSI